MSDTLLFILASGALVVVLVAGTILQEHRTERRFERRACPRCGIPFGRGAYATWHSHTRFAWHSRWDSGPLLICKHCKVRFRYTSQGHLHPEQFETDLPSAG